MSLSFNQTFLNERLVPNHTHTHTHTHTHIYIYIYRERERERCVGKFLRIKKKLIKFKKYHRTKGKKRPILSHHLKKIKRYAVSWSKEN